MTDILQKLNDSEINFSLACFFDGAWTVKLGDDMNGFIAEKTVGSCAEAIEWLGQEARRTFPDSLYATGKYPDGWRPDNPETPLLG